MEASKKEGPFICSKLTELLQLAQFDAEQAAKGSPERLGNNINDFNADMASAGFDNKNNLDDDEGMPPAQFGDAADPYALNDNDNMGDDDPEKAAFIN